MREQIYAADPGFLLAYLDKVENAGEADRKRAYELHASEIFKGDDAVDQIFRAEGDTAIISISGPLSMSGPDPIDLFYGYGGVSYPAIMGAIARASSDQFHRVICLANTPGGEVNGADPTYQAMTALAAKKNVRCQVSGMLASAGYYIMCPASKIVASSPTDLIGSIGAIIAGYDFTGALDQMGIKKYSIVSKNAPNKAADFSTKVGRNILQDRVDAIERIFYKEISNARKVSSDFIRENFGQGALYVARDPDSTKPDALRSKLIDSLTAEPGEFPVASNLLDDDEDDEDDDEEKLNETTPAVAGISHSQEVNNVTSLSEFLAQGPAAVAEMKAHDDKVVADAFAPVNRRITKCSGLLRSEVYSKSAVIRTKAIDCLEDKCSIDALDGAVGAFDMQAEQHKQDLAMIEQGAQGATPPQAPDAKAAEAAEIKATADGIASFFHKREA